MSDTLTVRLDEAARRALRQLTRGGRSRSEVVREALVAAVEAREREALREEVRRVAADPQDRAEARAVLEFMEGLDDAR
ncbi:MAG: ribbon-helix-helix protein, CopG family [Gaiellaceae bacterium]